MSEVQRTYLPAAGHDWALPLYDPLVKLLGGDRARRVLLDHAALRPGHRILDIGCGTGTLVLLIKRLQPDVNITALDPDPKALARGTHKADRARVSIQFDQGFSDALPYREASFDRVFSSFMLHHLQPGDKEKTLCEVRRVLQPGGSFHLLDFGGPESSRDGFLGRWRHSSNRLKDNSEGRVLNLLRQAGFAEPKRVGQGAMLFGRITYYYYQAAAPVSEASTA
jgi:ubiquinone/menaquinone biosynthesis C-methylase UbiE